MQNHHKENVMSYVHRHLRQLSETSENEAEQITKDLKQKIDLFREISSPLEDRLKRLIASIPESEQNKPRPLDWFRTRLRGVEGRGAHAGQLADVMRSIGWKRKRAWSERESGFNSLWYPPTI